MTAQRNPEAMFMETAWKLFCGMDIKAQGRCLKWFVARYRAALEEQRSVITAELSYVDQQIVIEAEAKP